MKAEELKIFLEKTFPGFEEAWNDPENCFKEDENNYHGLFTEFTHFFRENIDTFTNEQLSKCFDKVESLISNEDADNAVCTCFLENIAGEGITHKIKDFIGPKSFQFYKQWD